MGTDNAVSEDNAADVKTSFDSSLCIENQNIKEDCKLTIDKADALGIDLDDARDFANKNI